MADGAQSRLTVQLLDLADGLSSLECPSGVQLSCARDAAGQLWFATLKSAARIDPKGFEGNALPPPVKIESLVYHAPARHRAARTSARLTEGDGDSAEDAEAGSPGGQLFPDQAEHRIEIPSSSGRIVPNSREGHDCGSTGPMYLKLVVITQRIMFV